jgi:hypothetical protein
MSTTQIFWSKELAEARNLLVEARNLLVEAGFSDSMVQSDSPSIWGTIAPEPHSVGKNHFKALLREVYVAEAVGGWYVTSNIIGWMRFYRCRTVDYHHRILNIFGHGKTPVEAVQMFLTNFKAKRYNVGK